MTKKGYQRRLPTVLVPAPRPAAEHERAPVAQPPRQPEVEPEPPPPPTPVTHEARHAPAGPPTRSAIGKIVAASAVA